MCSLSWREPRKAQRPLLLTLDVLGPFEVLKRPLTMPVKDAKPPASGGPVAWWKFDESDGLEIADAAGNHHTARARGEPRTVQWQGGGALEFDGTKDYVDCGDSADFDFSGGVTVSLWMKLRESDESRQTIASKGGDTWRIQTDGRDANVLFTLQGPNTTGKDEEKPPQAKSKRSVDDGRWHHVVGVYDGERLALYLDGELEDALSASGLLALNTQPVWLGNNSSGRTELFNGWLDDVRLYDRGLREKEIRALYNGSGK